jgi:2-desacetyl-2-hydroxyethyl bacteriochlorophyllide A dehydrogenase
MRAVRATPDGPVEADVDEPGGDGVALDVASASICASDYGLMAMAGAGFTLGHEFAGRSDGVAYAVEPTLSCGACRECRVGNTQRCEGEHGILGVFIDGGMTARVTVPTANLVALPEGFDPSDACLVEPAAVAGHGLRRAAGQPGERIAVVGGGAIGLMAVAAAKAMGHDVDIEARHPHQRAAAERLGAGTQTGGYDVVIEAAGTESAVQRCVELARPGARIVLLGFFHNQIPISGAGTLLKELSWLGAMCYGRHDGVREVDEAAAMLAANPEVAATLITHRFPIDDAIEAFRVAADRASGAIKVVLQP